MRRAELLIVTMTLGGCMRIYPDPELPDVTVTWFEQDCRDGAVAVAITLTGLDTPSTVTTTVPCADLTVEFPDVARQRFHVGGALLDLAGNVSSTSEADVDLRTGFDQTADLYFGGFSVPRVRSHRAGGVPTGN